MILNEILAKLEGVRPGRDGQHMALCPAHADREPSLSVAEKDGRLLLHCFGGCQVADILKALGLEARGLFTDGVTPPPGLTLEALASAKGLPLPFLAAEGLTTLKTGRRPPAVAVPWRSDSGTPPLHIRHRLAKDGTGSRWTWKGKPSAPFGAWHLAGWLKEAQEGGLVPYLLICESEPDALVCWHAGVPAVASGGADFWKVGWARHLAGFERIALAQEPGQGGAAFVEVVGGDFRAEGLGEAVVVPFTEDAKDPGELWLRVGCDVAAFRVALQGMIQKAQAAAPVAASCTLGELLARVEAFLRRYVHFADVHAPVAVSLWVDHTWVLEAADTTPFLLISSPEKRSGKTRLLECLELLVKRPWRTISPTEAVLFRKIARDCPTLLLDEIDAIFRHPPSPAYEPLRALLNAGNRRGVSVPRCVGKGADLELMDFSIFCPKALAGIGTLPATVADRGIPLRLQRRAPGEMVARFRFREAREEARPIVDGLGAWASRAVAELRAARTEVPSALNDRAVEGWEPLLAIADAAGGNWPHRARAAALALHAEGATEESVGVLLLGAIRGIFEARAVDKLATSDLLAALVEREDGPWADWWGARVQAGDTRGPGRKLATLLRPYGIASRNMALDGSRPKGYALADFTDAFSRYLSAAKQRYNATAVSGSDMETAPKITLPKGESSVVSPDTNQLQSSVVALSKPQGEGVDVGRV